MLLTKILRCNTFQLSHLSQFYIRFNETNNTLSVTRISREINRNSSYRDSTVHADNHI